MTLSLLNLVKFLFSFNKQREEIFWAEMRGNITLVIYLVPPTLFSQLIWLLLGLFYSYYSHHFLSLSLHSYLHLHHSQFARLTKPSANLVLFPLLQRSSLICYAPPLTPCHPLVVSLLDCIKTYDGCFVFQLDDFFFLWKYNKP